MSTATIKDLIAKIDLVDSIFVLTKLHPNSSKIELKLSKEDLLTQLRGLKSEIIVKYSIITSPQGVSKLILGD